MTVPEDFLCLPKPVGSTSPDSILVLRTSSGPHGPELCTTPTQHPCCGILGRPGPPGTPGQQQPAAPAAAPHPQVVKDVADEGDVADPGLEGAGAQLLPVLVLLLQPVQQAPPEDALANLFALCL